MTDEQSAAAAAFARQRAAMAVQGTTAPEKAVLLVLAIMANAAGAAWPPIAGPTGIAARASLSRRGVQEALRSLEAKGYVSREDRPGRGAVYTLTLEVRAERACAPGAHVQEAREGCAPGAPKQPENNHRRKKATPSPSTRRNPYPMPDGTDPQAWADFLANRKRKRLPNTASAHATLIADLTRHATPEWPWPRLVALAAGKGWASVRNPDREDPRRGAIHHQRRPGVDSLRGSRPDPALDLRRAALAAIEAEERATESGPADSGPWIALPSNGGDG